MAHEPGHVDGAYGDAQMNADLDSIQRGGVALTVTSGPDAGTKTTLGGSGKGGGTFRSSRKPERTLYIPHTYESKGKPLPSEGGRKMNLPRKPIQGKRRVGIEEATGEWYRWSERERSAFASRAFALGYIKDPMDLAAAEKVWRVSVDRAANFAAQGKQVTPMEAFAMYAGRGSASGKRDLGPVGADGKPLANRTIVEKSRRVDITNATQAKSIITEAFLTSMGREPTSAEVRTLTRTLNAEQSANPDTLTSTQSYNSLGNPTGVPSSVTAGGLDAAQYVSDKAKADPEAAAYQGATTYFSALMSMLGSAV